MCKCGFFSAGVVVIKKLKLFSRNWESSRLVVSYSMHLTASFVNDGDNSAIIAFAISKCHRSRRVSNFRAIIHHIFHNDVVGLQ